MPDTPLIAKFFVTAKHVIDHVGSKSLHGKAFVRYNLKNGHASQHISDARDWLSHPTDPSVDVAILPLGLGWQAEADILFYPVEDFATAELIRKEGIGVGSNLFFPGMFSNHPGQDRNIPIVRLGNIAAMCEEKVKVGLGEIDAFLVEARSIGGLSGSPIFVSLHNPTPQGGYETGRESRFYLLGLMHGHFDLPETASDDTVADAAGTGWINTGIGIAIPADKILEVLNHPELVKRRNETAEKWKKDQVNKDII